MANQYVIYLSFFLIYFHIGGLATTNMLRLTAGATAPVLASKCFCDRCGAQIPPYLQLPIISFLLCEGKCKQCGGKIPVFPLLLELTVLLGMFVLTVALKCTVFAVNMSFLFYELLRVFTVIRLGKRARQFAQQYLIAVAAMTPFYLLTLFVAVIHGMI